MTLKITMQFAILMVVIAALILKRLETVFVTKKTNIQSVNLMDWTAAKTGNQLEIKFAMLKIIMNSVTLMQEIVVLTLVLEMVFVMMSTIIVDVAHMMVVIAVLMNLSH